MKTKLLWIGVGLLVVWMLFLALGCRVTQTAEPMRPFPVPASMEVMEYVVQQGQAGCPDGGAILISFISKDGAQYILFAGEPNPEGIAKWALVKLEEDPTTEYLWTGTATEGPVVTVLSGHGIDGNTFDPCGLVAQAKKTDL